MNSLQATVKDFRKVTDKSVNVVKGAMYYAFIPAILYFGLKTVDWAQFSPQQAWSYKNCKIVKPIAMILFVVFFAYSLYFSFCEGDFM